MCPNYQFLKCKVAIPLHFQLCLTCYNQTTVQEALLQSIQPLQKLQLNIHLNYQLLNGKLTISFQCQLCSIKTHDSMSCSQFQTSVYFAGTKKMLFSCICSSIVPDRKLSIFAVETASRWSSSHFKLELNPPSHH